MITVVTPAYNADRYIARAIASVQAQSVADWEMVIVDDGSADRTAAIIDDLARKDPRIRPIHIPNGGALNARLTGISEARGEYVTFLDADDTLRPCALETLLGHMTPDRDITVANLNLDNRRDFEHGISGQLTAEEYVRAILLGHTSIGNYAKLYRPRLFEGFRVPAGRITLNEDLLLLIHCASRAGQVFVDPKTVVYDYLWHDDSVSKSQHPPLEEWLRLFDEVERLIIPFGGRLREAFNRFRLNRLLDKVILEGIDADASEAAIAQLMAESRDMDLTADEQKCLKLLRSPLKRRFASWPRLIHNTLRRLYHTLK